MPRRRAVLVTGADPDRVRSATREETLPIGLGAVVLSFCALAVCALKGYMLLYGDAVAHLGIARRLVDTRNPGLGSLGGVWLPLPHLLMAPFVGRMEWWQNGMAGAWPSLLCYVVGVIGVYRLARRMMAPRWALPATAFYALNPNLLYLATTAMTEPLFLALLIWTVLLTMEFLAAPERAWRVYVLGVLIFLAVMTRYDGWVLGAAVWAIVVWRIRRVNRAMVLFTVLAVAGPVLWFWYNHHFAGDWLDFMRGPYSAAAIDRKTSPPGSKHYRGWHNLAWAAVFYTRTAQVDAVAWEFGFLVMAGALAGLWRAARTRVEPASALLWLPLPFYIYSVAYGSVPIFIPQLYPHSFYNSRYGMEMLPALAVSGFYFLATLKLPALGARLAPQGATLLVVANTIAMMYAVPLVLREAQRNSLTRVAFEHSIATELDDLPPGLPILMENSPHIGALQTAGIPLKQTVGESDWDSWSRALADPARHAAYVVALDGDPVRKAVLAHPEGLTEMTVLCTTGQGCARFYRSNRFGGGR